MNKTKNTTPACAIHLVTDELEIAEVVAFDGQARTITLRFDLMPCAAIGERWMVRPNASSSATPNPEGHHGA